MFSCLVAEVKDYYTLLNFFSIDMGLTGEFTRLDIGDNNIALYKMLPQYSDKTSKSKSVTKLDKISNTI